MIKYILTLWIKRRNFKNNTRKLLTSALWSCVNRDEYGKFTNKNKFRKLNQRFITMAKNV